jgi:hypothetical protein
MSRTKNRKNSRVHSPTRRDIGNSIKVNCSRCHITLYKRLLSQRFLREYMIELKKMPIDLLLES